MNIKLVKLSYEHKDQLFEIWRNGNGILKKIIPTVLLG